MSNNQLIDVAHIDRDIDRSQVPALSHNCSSQVTYHVCILYALPAPATVTTPDGRNAFRAYMHVHVYLISDGPSLLLEPKKYNAPIVVALAEPTNGNYQITVTKSSVLRLSDTHRYQMRAI